jgi:hypothetical protein
MATLTRFTTPYVGGPSFYTGTGVSGLVPDVFPVAIAGRPYMLDLKSGRFGRAFEQRLRDSQDGANIPGESAINPQGLWRRGQVSWHKGSAQKYGDTAEGVDTRFSSSKNVNPWVKGQLSMLKTTSQVLSSASTNLFMVVAGDRLYVADNQTLKYTTNLSTFSTVTGTPAAAINGMTTDGYTVFVSFESNGTYTTNTSLTSASSYNTGHNFGVLGYVKGRLMAGGSGSTDGHKLWNITASGNNPTVLYTHPNTAFRYVGFAAGQNHIYAAGFAGKSSLIYRTTIKADGTALDIPTQAGELPIGEVVSTIYGYLGYIVIGTNMGIRLATSDTNGDLIIGPVLETTTDVKCAVGDGRFVWYGWTNFDTTSTGLGRIDLSQFNTVNEPAYASDLMADVQGAVNAVVNWGDYRLFSISGQGIYREHATNLASTGYVDTGSWRWGIPDPKFATFVDFRTLPLTGSLTFALNLDNGGYESLATFDTPGVTEKTLDGSDTSFGEAAFKITFTRSATDSTVGPTLTRWQVRAFPAPKRSELFSVPILLHQKLNRANREYYYDVNDELSFLRNLIADTRITTYQEGEETFKVIVENVEWIPIDSHLKNWIFDGTAVITLRSLTA